MLIDLLPASQGYHENQSELINTSSVNVWCEVLWLKPVLVELKEIPLSSKTCLGGTIQGGGRECVSLMGTFKGTKKEKKELEGIFGEESE